MKLAKKQIIRQGVAVTKYVQEEINIVVNNKLDILEEQQKKAEAMKKNSKEQKGSEDIDLLVFQPLEVGDIKYTKKEEITGNKCVYVGELKCSYYVSAIVDFSPMEKGIDNYDGHLNSAGTSAKKRGKPKYIIPGFKYPWGIAITKNGEVVLAENLAHRITILNEDGTKLRSFGTKGEKEGQFTHPYGVAISQDEHILVTDSHRLQKLTFHGEFVQLVGSGNRENGPLKFDSPKGIAVHPTTGQIFIADRDNDRIQVLNKDLTYSHSFGSAGTNPETFKDPCDVAIDSKGHVYVADYWNHAIKKFTPNGKYISMFGSFGREPSELERPTAVAIGKYDYVYICEQGSNRVSIFDDNQTFVQCFGKLGKGEEGLNGPCGVTLDSSDRLYVVDTANDRVIVF